MWETYVKGGRALLYPILKGTYERGGSQPEDYEIEWGEAEERDLIIKDMKDMGRCIDYLESRSDIDANKLIFSGWSWGAYMGTFVCSADKRIKTGVLLAGGLLTGESEYLSSYVIGWAKRVKLPILMINGKYDTSFLLETDVKPLFNAIGAPPEHKRLVIIDDQHTLYVRRDEVTKAVFEWLDRYLGPVTRQYQQ